MSPPGSSVNGPMVRTGDVTVRGAPGAQLAGSGSFTVTVWPGRAECGVTVMAGTSCGGPGAAAAACALTGLSAATNAATATYTYLRFMEFSFTGWRRR
jgi:hypothetical protein